MMSDFDGTLQRPAGPDDIAGGPEDAAGGGPVGMADTGSARVTSAGHAVGMEDASAAGVMNARPGAPRSDTSGQEDVVGEERGITEDQVLGREPLPELED